MAVPSGPINVYVDAAVKTGLAGFAAVTATWSARRTARVQSVYEGELLAVLLALMVTPKQDVEIVTDSMDVIMGILLDPRRTYHGSFDYAHLWEKYDRLSADRLVKVKRPERKNKGLHGKAHATARGAMHGRVTAQILKTVRTRERKEYDNGDLDRSERLLAYEYGD